jgi:transposase-like protein
MTRPYSIAFKQKMIERLIGKDAVSAIQLARETGIRQQSLSRWLQEARSLPFVASPKSNDEQWSIEQKARVVADAASCSGEQLTAYLEAQGVKFAYPRLPFVGTTSARHWVERFVGWYNFEHRHSAIRYVTPYERHCGRERHILERRHELYQRAREANPERWSCGTRNWAPVETVVLNRDRAVSAGQSQIRRQLP